MKRPRIFRRSSVTGQSVSKQYADENPDTTTVEREWPEPMSRAACQRRLLEAAEVVLTDLRLMDYVDAFHEQELQRAVDAVNGVQR